MERRVLEVLHFRLTYADPTTFLGYFLHLTCNTHDQTVRGRAELLLHSHRTPHQQEFPGY